MSLSNKIFSVIFLMIIALSNAIQAQVRFSAWSYGYFNLRSYLGYTSDVRFNTFQFEMNTGNGQTSNWSMSVRLLSPIMPSYGGVNKSGKAFPADKISLRWTEDNNLSYFNIAGIGASRNPIYLQNANEVFLIEKSKQPFRRPDSGYLLAQLYSQLQIAPGKYLEEYTSWSDYLYLFYDIPLLFTIYETNGRVIGTQRVTLQMMVSPKLTDGHLVDVEPEFSLQLSANALNTSLQFLNKQHYTEGVKVQVPDAIQVHANTDFELRVKSMDAEIMRAEGGGLPLSILSLQITPTQGAPTTISNPKIVLSGEEQVAYSGQSKDKDIRRYFRVDYEANLSRLQVLQAKSGTYGVSLLYLIMPK